jgi:hypothetical protein
LLDSREVLDSLDPSDSLDLTGMRAVPVIEVLVAEMVFKVVLAIPVI